MCLWNTDALNDNQVQKLFYVIDIGVIWKDFIE